MSEAIETNAAPEVAAGTGAAGAGEGQGAETQTAAVETSVLGAADSPDVKAPANWPDNWRELAAGGDADLMKRLSRFTDPRNVVRSWAEAQKKISQGPQPRPDPQDAAALAEWRKREGIPDKPDGYKVPEVEGFKWADADKPVLADFFEFVHTKDMRPADAQAALEWYGRRMQAQQTQQAEADRSRLVETRQALIDQWGPEFTANKRLAEEFVKSTPLGEALYSARLADGRVLGSTPEFIQWAAEQGRMTFGDASLIGSDGSSTASSRKEEIERTMRDDYEAYLSKGMDKELSKILEAETKMRRR